MKNKLLAQKNSILEEFSVKIWIQIKGAFLKEIFLNSNMETYSNLQ